MKSTAKKTSALPRSPRRKEGDSPVGTSAFPPHDPATCHICQTDRELANYVATGEAHGVQPLAGLQGGPHASVCLVCPTEIAPEDNFCAHCYSQIPTDLVGLLFNCRTQNGKLIALQGILDTLARGPQGDPNPYGVPASAGSLSSPSPLRGEGRGEVAPLTTTFQEPQPLTLEYWNQVVAEAEAEIAEHKAILDQAIAHRSKHFPTANHLQETGL